MAGTIFMDCEDLRKVGFPHGETAYGAFVREGVDLNDKGLTEVRVALMCRDEDPADPNDWDNGKITLFGRGGASREHLFALGMGECEDEGDEQIMADPFARAISVYDHSGLALWRMDAAHGYCQHAAWDTTRVGGIWVADDSERDEFAGYAAKILATGSAVYAGQTYGTLAAIVNCYADNDIATYQQYVNGEVYGYIVTDFRRNAAGRWVEWDVLDSCWGYFGYDYATEDIANEIAYLFRDPAPVNA